MNFNVASARQAVGEGWIEAWICRYLHTKPWANVKIWRFLRRRKLVWAGPLEIELSRLRRTCGPEAGMRYQEDPDYWEAAVTEIEAGLGASTDLPPLLVSLHEGEWIIMDGNHRHEAFHRRGWHTCWILIGRRIAEGALERNL